MEIDNLEEKLEGKLPVTREELFILVNSWGREFSFITDDEIKVERCLSKECYDLSNLDVSQITDLSYMFRESLYNGNLSKWDVSNCIDMELMFCYSVFNKDLSSWDVSNVKNIDRMFSWSYFNNNSLKDWNVSNVKSMIFLFYKSKFNSDISKWDISNVLSFENGFGCSIFDGDTNEFKKKIAFLFKFFNEIFVSLKQCGLNYVISNRFSLLESLIN